MLKELLERWRQGDRTMAYPQDAPTLPDRFRGRPSLPTQCDAGCHACEAVCPTGAITVADGKPSLDLGRCLFCADCAAACQAGALGGTVHSDMSSPSTASSQPHGDAEPGSGAPSRLVLEGARLAGFRGHLPLSFTAEHRLSALQREDLLVGPERPAAPKKSADPRIRLIRRSFKLRQVCAGGCGACEADINVLSTVVFDLGRFGIQIVASPRHADGLLITGPVTENMKHALEKTYHAMPSPRLVIAVGACAISGGPYLDHDTTHNGVAGVLPVDLWIPGCPPHPLTILDGLLQLQRA